jgi:hypothetical protein
MRDLRLQKAPKNGAESRAGTVGSLISTQASASCRYKSQFSRLHVFPGFRERRQHWLVGLRAMSIETQEIST